MVSGFGARVGERICNRGGMMRSMPMRLLLGATVAAVLTVAPAAANAGSSSVAKVGALKLCTYRTGDANEGSQTFIVKVVASGGAGVRGTLRMTGPGLSRTVPFKLKKGGIGLVALPLTPPVTLTLTTTLVVKPVVHTRTDHVAFTATNTSPTAAPRGCVAR
jgi:hypothetical protein